MKEAIERGFPAGCIYPTDSQDNEDDLELRLAFDFDGVIDRAHTTCHREARRRSPSPAYGYPPEGCDCAGYAIEIGC